MTTFLTLEEMASVIQDYQLYQITTDQGVINQAILAAIDEATSYLNSQYDCTAIFAAVDDQRNVLVLEHCKSIALWYLVRLANADMYYDRVKSYYDSAVKWLEKVAGVGSLGRSLAPNLPLKQTDGVTQTKFRAGSNRKFSHNFD